MEHPAAENSQDGRRAAPKTANAAAGPSPRASPQDHPDLAPPSTASPLVTTSATPTVRRQHARGKHKRSFSTAGAPEDTDTAHPGHRAARMPDPNVNMVPTET